jgi:hypothetical protein
MSEDKKKEHYYSGKEKRAVDTKKDETNESKHTPGHSIEITQAKTGEFMCPECGKTFETKDTTEKHLHAEHIKHLRAAHSEYHGKDTGHKHQS